MRVFSDMFVAFKRQRRKARLKTASFSTNFLREEVRKKGLKPKQSEEKNFSVPRLGSNQSIDRLDLCCWEYCSLAPGSSNNNNSNTGTQDDDRPSMKDVLKIMWRCTRERFDLNPCFPVKREQRPSQLFTSIFVCNQQQVGHLGQNGFSIQFGSLCLLLVKNRLWLFIPVICLI